MTSSAATRVENESPGTGAVQLFLLDGFELRANGCSVSLPLAAQRLIAFLALHERPILRPFVAASMWLDTTDERAAANLRSALWRVRRSGVSVVTATATHMAIHADVWVDARVAMQRARKLALDPRAIDTGIDLVDGVDGLLGAELLPDYYDEWAIIERERLRHLRLHALERVSHELTLGGRFAEAIDAALLAISAEPLRETAHRALIVAHLAEGNRDEAVRQYRRYAATVAEQLGAEPSASLMSLMQRHAGPEPVGPAALTFG